MPKISNPKNDRRSLTQTGNEVGSSNVSLTQNAANTNSPIISWTCPRKFDSIRYAGGRHKTRFVPRYEQTVSGTAGDDTVVTLDGDIQPIAGEEKLDEHPYDAVVAYNVTQSSTVDISAIDYNANEVTLASDPADGDTVKLWPILIEGTVQYRGLDQFSHEIAPLDEWSTPVHVFHDFDQMKNETEIHLVGAAEWEESETLALYMDSPRQIVWQDSDFPNGAFVSQIEQRVDVTV
jgi:hypothetical protein